METLRVALIFAVAFGLSGCLTLPTSVLSRTQLDIAVQSSHEEPGPHTYTTAFADINNDSLVDAIVLMSGPLFCGSGGCSLMVFQGTSQGFELRSHSTISREPIYLMPVQQHNWHSLAVLVAGGGIQSHHALMQFNGTSYPVNPSIQPEVSELALSQATRLRFE